MGVFPTVSGTHAETEDVSSTFPSTILHRPTITRVAAGLCLLPPITLKLPAWNGQWCGFSKYVGYSCVESAGGELLNNGPIWGEAAGFKGLTCRFIKICGKIWVLKKG